ncbi:UDP-Glycosyltransferase superfamily protein [Striga asiatica]|uniref:UDP-Glycosyltransferase superfamily protein n=1 Tax=Striga asiatica TaxID=4170 RepID=A0A5A7RAH0_STRAF|nr:UDP-Glycosyltransferase superfamily protein [Striga asiatica]
MAIKENQPHFVLLPFMAQGHMIPMVDISRLLAKRGITVTILLSPNNHNRVKPIINREVASGSSIRVSHFRFPSVEAGLPESFESLEGMLSVDESLKFLKATTLLEDRVEQILRNLEPRPACLISDMCFMWSAAVATRLRIPRIVFHGPSCFALVCMHLMKASNNFEDIAASDTEYFVLPELPDRIEITKAQIRGTAGEMPPEWAEFRRKMFDSESESLGTIANSFEELEPEYLRRYVQVKGKKVWCIGPVSLCNEDELDKAQRGKRASVDEHECLQWLGSRELSSIVYVCLGSLSRLAATQLVELGLGLEGSGRPFVWVVRNAPDEFETWLEDEKFEERGLAAGVPMLTWPVFAEQFLNEKFILSVAKTGVRMGVEVPVASVEEEKVGVQVRSEGIKAAIEELMDGGERGAERRERARELGKMAKRAIEEGVSSFVNLTRLVNDVCRRGDDDCGDEYGNGEVKKLDE